jgi:hypothetical protein
MSNKVFAGRIQADFSQFPIYDSSADIGELPDWTEGDNYAKGFISNGSSINIATYAGSYQYWIEVYLSETIPSLENCDRVLAFNLQITSGELIISDMMEAGPNEGTVRIPLEVGSYIIYIFGYSLVYGNDVLDDLFLELDNLNNEELDSELERRTDIENYKIILMPGKIEVEGVIKGERYRGGITPQ